MSSLQVRMSADFSGALHGDHLVNLRQCLDILGDDACKGTVPAVCRRLGTESAGFRHQFFVGHADVPRRFQSLGLIGGRRRFTSMAVMAVMLTSRRTVADGLRI